MADELQALLNKINEQGVAKAEDERNRILADATKEAELLRKQAREQAAALVDEARREAELLTEKGRQALRQAARDTILSLREALQSRMVDVARATLGAVAEGGQLADIIGEAIAAYLKHGGKAESITVLVPEKNARLVEEHLLQALGEDLRKNVEIAPVKGLGGGFKISFDKDDVVYDFSDVALADAFCHFVNPRLAEIVKTDLSEAGTGK